MLQTQYNDFFQERANTAYNFKHNLAVYCRREANSPCDALNVAKTIISRMNPEERIKTHNLLKTISGKDETINQYIVRSYHDAIKEVPLNEEYIKYHLPENKIARPFYDTVSTDGQKVDNDPQLIKLGNNYNLTVGDSLRNVAIASDKLFGSGKENVHFSELKVISASKENNTITLMDKNKSFIDLPRDTVLDVYKQQTLKEIKRQQRIERNTGMEFSYG